MGFENGDAILKPSQQVTTIQFLDIDVFYKYAKHKLSD